MLTRAPMGRRLKRLIRRSIIAFAALCALGAVLAAALPKGADVASIRGHDTITTRTLAPRMPTTTTRPPYIAAGHALELGPVGAGIIR